MTTEDDAPRVFGDRYVLGERISSGEDREVWHAHDDVIGRQVALKIFYGARATNPTWREAFRHNADRLAALSHPGIAKIYEAGRSDDETWLATAFIDGEPLPARLDAEPPLDVAVALNLIGQTALAIQAAHDAGISHGALSPASLLIRSDDVVAVIGFAVGSGATQAEDLRALGELAHACLGGALRSTPDLSPDVEDFVSWVNDPKRPKPPADAADIGRTALALAAALSGTQVTNVVPSRVTTSPMDDTPSHEPRYDVAERKRVRNKLISLGAITVIGGAILLFLFGQGGGETTVPYVIGVPVDQAKNILLSAGLRANPVVGPGNSDSGGTVAAEIPAAGTRVKDGSQVTITVNEGNP